MNPLWELQLENFMYLIGRPFDFSKRNLYINGLQLALHKRVTVAGGNLNGHGNRVLMIHAPTDAPDPDLSWPKPRLVIDSVPLKWDSQLYRDWQDQYQLWLNENSPRTLIRYPEDPFGDQDGHFKSGVNYIKPACRLIQK